MGNNYGDPEKVLEQWNSKKQDQFNRELLDTLKDLVSEVKAVKEELHDIKSRM